MTDTPIPPDYGPYPRRSPFTDPWRPLFCRERAGDFSIGTLLRREHCNSRGLVHGGFIAALADNAMGLSIVGVLKERGEAVSGMVTTNLSIDYTGQAKIGDWLQTESEIIRIGGTLAFARGRLVSGERTVATCHATFRVMRS